MTVALLGYVATFARDVPWWDDWDLVPVLSGQEPVSWAWLWERHNEHRIVIPKLIHLALAAPAGADFRAGAYLSCLALAAAAAALIVAARRLRGRTSVADALFPLVLLHWGQAENLLWSFQVQFVLSTVLFVAVVVLMATAAPAPGLGRSLLIGLCAVALPFCGANGAALVPALVVWLIAAAGVSGRGGWLLAALAALAGGAVALTLLAGDSSGPNAPDPGVGRSLLSGLLVPLMADGLVGAVPGGLLVGELVLLLALAGAVVLGWACLAGRVDRLRGLGVLAGLGAAVTLGVGVGWGRAGLHANDPRSITLVTRYVTLMAPLACCAALAWLLVGGRLVPYLLLAAAALMLPVNTLVGLAIGRARADVLDRLTADARAGMSPAQLSDKYRQNIHPVDRDLLARRFAMLRRARLGPYRGLPADLPAGPPGGRHSLTRPGRGPSLTGRQMRLSRRPGYDAARDRPAAWEPSGRPGRVRRPSHRPRG
jgi:hypothetical protein